MIFFKAFPHAEVETREFYKHIAQDLLEPKRMKQLLVWCGSRALSEKPLGNVEDANERMTGKYSAWRIKRDWINKLTILAARTIQEELLKEFATNSDLSDVFSKVSTVMLFKGYLWVYKLLICLHFRSVMLLLERL